MADHADREAKTEQASPRRVEEALKKGNTPFSREVGTVASLLAVGLLLPIVAADVAHNLVPGLAMFLDRPSDFKLETSQDIIALAWLVGTSTAASIWPAFLGLVLVGVIASGLQNAPRIVLRRIKPDASRLSMAKGLQRVLGAQGRVEFTKALLKIVVVCLACYLIARTGPERILTYSLMSHTDLPSALIAEVAALFFVIGLIATTLAAADMVWTRFKWQLDLRMSRHELKEEQRQAEGDPLVRARQRSLARDRARRRMMAAVPRATLVVANPTHYAVAMRYVHGESATPLVLAKGVDHIALRIREIAASHGIPVVEDRALAKSMYQSVKADRPIPPEFYRAIAEIILLLMSRRGTSLRGT
jgi:flagellar biosynthetic protein FlhB